MYVHANRTLIKSDCDNQVAVFLPTPGSFIKSSTVIRNLSIKNFIDRIGSRLSILALVV